MSATLYTFYNSCKLATDTFVDPSDLVITWEQNPPVNDINGIFPDSFVSFSIDDYYEGEFILSDPNQSAVVKVQLPQPNIYFPIVILGVGEQVDTDTGMRNVYAYTSLNGKISNDWSGSYICRADEDFFDGMFSQGSCFPIGYYDAFYLRILFEKAGTFRIRFHNIRFYK